MTVRVHADFAGIPAKKALDPYAELRSSLFASRMDTVLDELWAVAGGMAQQAYA